MSDIVPRYIAAVREQVIDCRRPIMSRPSIARDFYDSIRAAEDPFALFQTWINASPPVTETEWREFKSGPMLDDKRKEIWSKALAGFANTQGGVLVWGIECKKIGAPAVDQVSGFSLVDSPHTIASRLMELHHQASEPPVLGVEVIALPSPSNPKMGIVVCFIPESPSRPHRAEYSKKQYYIRAGDDFVVPSVSLLRCLFVPTANSPITPIIESHLVDTPSFGGVMTRIHFNCYARNTGLVSSDGALLTLQGEYPGDFNTPQGWRKHDTAMSPISFESPRSIFPGETMQVFSYVYPVPIRRPGNANFEFPREFGQSFRLRVFAHNQNPTRGSVEFNEDDIVRRVKKPCLIDEIAS
jgi:hypothetical protein